jgi:hypothetical protein
MGYASKLGRARISSRNPQAAGRCDGCGFIVSHSELRPQMQWAGNKLINLKQLVCRRCNDIPQTQLRAIVLPADPMPVINPRPENYVAASTDYRATSGQDTVNPITNIPIPGNTLRITENDDYRVTQQTGAPNGSLNELPGTDPNAVTYRNISGAVDNGAGLIRLTVDTTNGMITGQRVTVGGVDGTTEANNNWTITVISLTEIDLDGSVFTNAYVSGGYVVNNPALPYGFTEIPPTGPL